MAETKTLKNPYVAIIGITDYGDKTYNLPAVQQDVENMRNLWSNKFKYDPNFISVITNCVTRKSLNKFLKDIRNKLDDDEKYKECDGLIVIYSGHGTFKKNSNYVSCSDGKDFLLAAIQNKFTSDECELLAGKPKIFFMDCCRAGRTPKPFNIQSQSKLPGDNHVPVVYTNKLTDVYTHFATCTNQVSYTAGGDRTDGSWFLNALYNCYKQKLMTNPNGISLDDTAIMINDRLNTAYEGQQTAETKSTFTYKVFIEAKKVNEALSYKIENYTEIQKYPRLANNLCIGDPNNAIKILKQEQHDDYKESEDMDIPGLGRDIELYDFQKRGVEWMIEMEEKGNEYGSYGGLLCDEMGLGKTVQTIALMLIQRQRKECKDRTIIITPLSLIDQWETELEKIAPNQFNIRAYHGDKVDLANFEKADFEQCDILLTTVRAFSRIKFSTKTKQVFDKSTGQYDTEFVIQEKDDEIAKLPSKFFSRIVMDECHQIANGKQCETISTFCNLRGIQNRWAVTGTPLNKNIHKDLAGMSCFIGIPYNKFEAALNMKITKTWSNYGSRVKSRLIWLDLDREDCIERIKQFLNPMMLKRRKNDANIKDYPKKIEKLIPCALNEEEKFLYNTTTLISNNVNTVDTTFKWRDELDLVTRLRKLTIHPSLCIREYAVLGIEKGEKGAWFKERISGLNVDKSDKWIEQKKRYIQLMEKYIASSITSTKMNALIKKIKEIQENNKGDKTLIFSHFLDVFEFIGDTLKDEGIKYEACISTLSRKKRKQVLDKFNDKTKGFDILFISEKSVSVGLNLQCANHIIFLDDGLNSPVENQAIGRCWRLGQKKQVTIYRLITKNI